MSVINGNEPVIASGPQPKNLDESNWGIAKFGFGISAVAASGFIKTKNGRLWDKYISSLRSVETGSPGGILRTFRGSELLSPLETWNKFNISPEQMQTPGAFGGYLQSVIGDQSRGVSVSPAGKVFGEVRGANNELLGYALHGSAGTQRGQTIADYFARLSGVKVPENLSVGEGALYAEWEATFKKSGISFNEWKSWPENRIRQPKIPFIGRLREELNIAGKKISLSKKQSELITKAELGLKYHRSYAATTVGRLNNLLQKPFEIPVLGKALEKIPFISSMAIEPGSATQMWGRYIKKGVQAGLVWKGLEYYDYLRAESQPAAATVGTLGGAAIGGLLFKKPLEPISKRGLAIGAAVGLYTSLAPRFDHGLFHGLASVVTDANLYRAKFSDTIGLTDQLQSQNMITPGLVSGKAALAAAGTGALIGGISGYGGMVLEAAKTKIQKKLPFHEIFGHLRIERAEQFADKWAGSWFGKTLGKIPGGVGESLSKLKSPAAVGALAGVGIWAAVSSTASILSGNFLAAVPGLNLLGSDESEEQLQRWYSGEEEVAVRKGRWWEMGRSSSYS